MGMLSVQPTPALMLLRNKILDIFQKDSRGLMMLFGAIGVQVVHVDDTEKKSDFTRGPLRAAWFLHELYQGIFKGGRFQSGPGALPGVPLSGGRLIVVDQNLDPKIRDPLIGASAHPHPVEYVADVRTGLAPYRGQLALGLITPHQSISHVVKNLMVGGIGLIHAPIPAGAHGDPYDYFKKAVMSRYHRSDFIDVITHPVFDTHSTSTALLVIQKRF